MRKLFTIPALVLGGALLLAGCGGGGSETPAEPPTEVPTPDPDAERAEITSAIDDAESAVAAVNDNSDAATVAAAEMAVAAARKAIAAADDLSDEEKAAHSGAVDAVANLLSAAKQSRTASMTEEERLADIAAGVQALKFYNGISGPMGTAGTPAAGDRIAAYNTAETAIDVSAGLPLPPGTPAAVTLSEDKKTVVAALHGWQGKRYADPAGGESYEAGVYSNVEAPTPGDKFGQVGVATAVDGYQYGLDANGVFTPSGGNTGFVAANVAIPSVTRTAGTETFELPESNPTGGDIIPVAGRYHGVPGTYFCNTADGANNCTATVASGGNGLTLGGTGTWTFKPSDPNARVMSAVDTVYASYGWWLYKSADDKTYIASAFTDEKGDVDTGAIAISALNGGATYEGGAAGQYAISSSTGDSGHFTAKALLNADFDADMVSGTIDDFIGADGQQRNWLVELKKSGFADTGEILGADGTGDPMMTVWTIDGSAAADSGQWSGEFRKIGDDGVPEVATGTFYSEYGNTGKMVGAFGANVQ